MKIKITAVVPVETKVRPIIGNTYEVIRFKYIGAYAKLFFIEVNGEEVGVYEKEECEVVNNA